MRSVLLLSFCVLAFPGCTQSAAAGPNSDAGLAASRADAMTSAEASVPRVVVAPSDAGASEDNIPPTSSDELAARGKHLLEAIVQGNASLATDIVVPRELYLDLREAADPAKAWEKQVKLPFEKSIKRLQHGKRAIERAQFVGIELGHTVVQTPAKKKDWKRPVWRVRHSKLLFTIDGKQHKIDIPEMIAWRNAWYVASLSRR